MGSSKEALDIGLELLKKDYQQTIRRTIISELRSQRVYSAKSILEEIALSDSSSRVRSMAAYAVKDLTEGAR